MLTFWLGNEYESHLNQGGFSICTIMMLPEKVFYLINFFGKISDKIFRIDVYLRLSLITMPLKFRRSNSKNKLKSDKWYFMLHIIRKHISLILKYSLNLNESHANEQMWLKATELFLWLKIYSHLIMSIHRTFYKCIRFRNIFNK